MAFGLLGSAGEQFGGPDHVMRAGHVGVQRECMFALGDAFDGAVGEEIDSAQ